MRLRRSYNTEAREQGLSMWSRGRHMTFSRLPGSPNRILPMLQISCLITCAAYRHQRDLHRTEELLSSQRVPARITIAKVHSYGKGIVGVGFTGAN